MSSIGGSSFSPKMLSGIGSSSFSPKINSARCLVASSGRNMSGSLGWMALWTIIMLALFQTGRLYLDLIPSYHQHYFHDVIQLNSTQSTLHMLHLLQRSQLLYNQTEHALQELRYLQQTFNRKMKEDRVSPLEDRLASLEHKSKIYDTHIIDGIVYTPLRDDRTFKFHGDNGQHGFLSEFIGRGRKQGPPELFYFPSPSHSEGRFLCFKGNHTRDGSKNFYALIHKDIMPKNALFLPGTTLISDTYWDYVNPWHSMLNTMQFAHWKVNNSCARPARILLYHWGELRTYMGYWISNVMGAIGLPSQPEPFGYGDNLVCFENAIVSRVGLGGVPQNILIEMFREVRCLVRRSCNITRLQHRDLNVPTSSEVERHVHVTLLVRNGGRGFVNEDEWRDVVRQECQSAKACKWSVVHATNLTFCQQAEVMTRTDILISPHGAQLTNMIFMSPGRHIMEIFPKGWLELAGSGQYVFRNLARWVGLIHEGYWRDPNGPDCPNPNDKVKCFSFYKDGLIGINRTHISSWLRNVISSFSHTQGVITLPISKSNPQDNLVIDSNTCVCPL